MRNRLLRSLAPADVQALEPFLVEVELPGRTMLFSPPHALPSLYFIESGLVSLVAVAGPERIEVGLVGREGAIGVGSVLGANEAVHDSIVQVPGHALRISAEDLRRCIVDRPGIAEPLLLFVQVLLMQVSHTALANGRSTVEQRLARWLVMAHDRLESDEIALTHEFLAAMLGVRRPGVTVALHMLEGAHAIRSRRNSITILDREKLKATAGHSYGEPERLYANLFGIAVAKDALPLGSTHPRPEQILIRQT